MAGQRGARRVLVPFAFFLILTMGSATPASTSESLNEIPWEIRDCQYVYGSVPVSAILLTQYMPEGFRATGPAGPNGIANLAFETNLCQRGTGLDGWVEPMVFVSFWVAALYPSEYAQPGDGFRVVNFDPVIPDEPRRTVLQEAGMAAHDGAVRYESIPFQNGGELVRRVEADVEGIGTIQMEIAGKNGLIGGGRGHFTQYTELSDGSLARWETDWAARAGARGDGTITVPLDSWFAEVMGSPTGQAQFDYGTWDYTNGRIQWPIPGAGA